MSLSVGGVAPEFSLPDQDKQVVSLSELRGTPVLVVFYPFAFSGLCTGELCQLRDELSVYTDAVLSGTPPPVSGADGRAGVAAALALLESSRTGQVVRL